MPFTCYQYRIIFISFEYMFMPICQRDFYTFNEAHSSSASAKLHEITY